MKKYQKWTSLDSPNLYTNGISGLKKIIIMNGWKDEDDDGDDGIEKSCWEWWILLLKEHSLEW